jgi:UDP-N-acetylmuramate--alanine ligase
MKKKIFFVGIGGKGLNGIAKICLEKGWDVSGVDNMIKPETLSLEKSGAKIFYKHNRANIDSETHLVVYTSIAKNAPEVLEAKDMGVVTMKRSEFLGVLTKNDYKICVAGSHGKSTTTALLGLSTINSGIDATIFGGAYSKELGGYNHIGKSQYSIIEACEYDRSFFDLIGNTTILTSVEKSHLEYYKNEQEMLEAFTEFFNKHERNAYIFTNGDCVKTRLVTSKTKASVIYFGFSKKNDYIIENIQKSKQGATFSIRYHGKYIIENIKINLPGDYNILNYASVVAVMHQLGFDLSGVRETAEIFSGVGRRFEIHQNRFGLTIIDDFAHHPTQVKYLFDGIRQYYPKQKVCAVFQPRQFNLIKNFITEYGESFQKADEVIVTDILPALGDTQRDVSSLSTEDLISEIENRSDVRVKHINSFPEITNYIKNKYSAQDIITTIGAGDIYKVKDSLMA